MIFRSIVSVSVFFAAEGCDPNQQLLKAKGKTAMHAAAAGGYVDIMACLRLVNQQNITLNSEMTGLQKIKFVKPAVSEEQVISEFPCASVSKRVYVRNHFYENDFDLHENETMQNSFSYEWFRTQNRFETEAQENSEMTY